MIDTAPKTGGPRSLEDFIERPARTSRSSFVVGVAINSVLLVGAHRLLDWRWPSFLTDDFAELLPIVTVALAGTIAVNAACLFIDAAWLRSLGTLITSALAMALTVRTWQVFPFAFTDDSVRWADVARGVLVLAMIGIAISLVVETVRLVATLALRVGGHGPTRDAQNASATRDAEPAGHLTGLV